MNITAIIQSLRGKKCPIHVINQVKEVNIISPKNQYLVVNFLFTLLKSMFNVLILGY